MKKEEVPVKDLQGKGICVIAEEFSLDLSDAFTVRADANLWDCGENQKEE